MIDDWKRLKWLPVTAGALLCLVGLAALIWPVQVMSILPLVVGLAVLCLGAVELSGTFAMRGKGGREGPPLLQGIASVAVGLVLLFNRRVSLVFMGVVLGLWALVCGALRLRDALSRRCAGESWGSCALDAGLKLALGVFMLLHPIGSMALWTQMIGAFFLIAGGSVIFSALYLDRSFHDFDDF